jgi:hypothetical protein
MYDVAIVGAGPVGAVAANLCGVYGLAAVAFDRAPDVYDLPRAAGVYDDVQRILHNAGVLDAILAATCEMVGAEFLDASGKRIIGFEVPWRRPRAGARTARIRLRREPPIAESVGRTSGRPIERVDRTAGAAVCDRDGGRSSAPRRCDRATVGDCVAARSVFPDE